MNLALLVGSIIASALGTIPGIPAAMGIALNAVTASLGVILKNGLGTTAPLTISVVLATLQGIIAQLKTVQGLPQESLNQISVLEDALAAALNLHITSVDPAALKPIAPVA